MIDPPAMDREPTDRTSSDDEETSEADFQQRCTIASVRMSLFGRAPTLSIGRYSIEKRLGAGGMGEVYLGRDAALGRKLAIKRVRADRDGPRSAERLQNEARALARLSHPNVVQVYEVGEHEGQTFVAMEYVEGQTLAAWLAAQPRSWQGILAVFVAAGRGLAAAHSAGVVHRDFKPDNVLISAQGRVCVADFGLAQADAGESGVRASEVAGTVRYMSLEQLRGENVDARSDQFSFCVALYEALWQREPFGPARVAERVQALLDGRPLAPPRSGVPRSLWPIVRRGLQREPADRWPNFDELLAALEAVPIRRRRRAMLGVALPLSLGLGWALLHRGEPAVCTDLASELSGVWDDDTAAALEQAFAATEVAHATTSFARVDRALDGWAQAWTETREAQCEAAAREHDDPALARARRTCLEQQRRAVEVLTSQLARADVDTVDRAVEAVARLPAPSECSTAELLDGPTPPSAELLADIEPVQLELAAARALRELGRPDLDAVARLVEQARALEHPPLLAEVLAEQGRAEIEGGSPRRGLELLDEATELALASNHPRLLAQTWTEVALHRATDYPEPLLASHQLDLAESAWARIGTELDVRTRARLAFGRGRLAQLDGDAELAAARYREALASIDADAPERPGYLGALAEISAADEQLQLREQALATAEVVFGPDHPETAIHVYNLASARRALGQHEQARALLVRATAIWTQAHRTPHPNLARAHLLLADQAMQAGEWDQAEQHARAMATIQAQTLPPEHPDHGDPELLLSRIMGLRGDHVGALAHAHAALQHWQRGTDPAAPHVLQVRLDIAAHEIALGQFARAQAELEVVLAQVGPDDGLNRGVAALNLAELALRQGQLDQARAHLRAIAAAGPELLADQEVSYLVLDALVELRSGCRSCVRGAGERIAARMQVWGWQPETVAAWLVELAVTPAEAALLGVVITD
jgi:tetratricopeptide (TPR) repeat protein/predicted Ser/Thr protein kinase